MGLFEGIAAAKADLDLRQEDRRISKTFEDFKPRGAMAAEEGVEAHWIALAKEWEALEKSINAHERDQRPALAEFEGRLRDHLRVVEAWWKTVPPGARVGKLAKRLAWEDKAERSIANVRRMRDRRMRAEG